MKKVQRWSILQVSPTSRVRFSPDPDGKWCRANEVKHLEYELQTSAKTIQCLIRHLEIWRRSLHGSKYADQLAATVARVIEEEQAKLNHLLNPNTSKEEP